jgi:hypothetical protein
LLGPGRVTILERAGTHPNMLLGRYADELAVDLGPLPGERVELQVPGDRSDRPWRLGLRGDGPVTICLGNA